jgi:glycosyltransferase involved in cell wall biosynthesis
MVDFLADTYAVKAVYIPNGIAVQKAVPLDLSDRFGISAQRFILFAGRLVPEKDVHVLIQAFQNLIAQPAFAHTHLLLAGDSAFSDSYVRRLRRLAGPATHFLGLLEPASLASLYSQAAVCVLPSRLEGMPLVLLEAASHACPVIAADIPAHRQTLGKFAHYFSPRSVQALQHALAQLLSNPVPAAQLARAARRHVTRLFSWDRIAQRMEDAYLCALRQASPPR